MKHANIIEKLNLEQKCALLSGDTVFTTRALPKAGIPSVTLSDGPNGVRKQAGAADHRGPVSYTHLRAHETPEHLVCRLLLEKKKKKKKKKRKKNKQLSRS